MLFLLISCKFFDIWFEIVFKLFEGFCVEIFMFLEDICLIWDVWVLLVSELFGILMFVIGGVWVMCWWDGIFFVVWLILFCFVWCIDIIFLVLLFLKYWFVGVIFCLFLFVLLYVLGFSFGFWDWFIKVLKFEDKMRFFCLWFVRNLMLYCMDLILFIICWYFFKYVIIFCLKFFIIGLVLFV